MPWFYDTVSGELANESGLSALPYEIGGGWHQLKIAGSATWAQAAADAQKEFPSGATPTGGQVQGLEQEPAGAAAAATGGSFSSIQNALSGFYDKLTDGKMWRSLGWLLLGIVIMLLGVLLWIGPSAARRSPAGLAAQALG